VKSFNCAELPVQNGVSRIRSVSNILVYLF